MFFFSNFSLKCSPLITIDLLYFSDVYDINLWEKIWAKVQHIHAEQMSFHHFKEIGFDVINMNYEVQ